MIDHNTACPACGCQCMTIEECHKQQNRHPTMDQKPVDQSDIGMAISELERLNYEIGFLDARQTPDERLLDARDKTKNLLTNLLSTPEREAVTPPDVDLRLVDDAITKLTKAAANLVNGQGFTSCHSEDHNRHAPRWLLKLIGSDDQKRIDLGQDVAQATNWVRNATSKLREWRNSNDKEEQPRRG